MADNTDKLKDALPASRSSGKEGHPGNIATKSLNAQERLRLFEAASERQRAREAARKSACSGNTSAKPPEGRDWTREDLYC